MNRTFNDIVSFLEQHFFVFSHSYAGSHRYYKGYVDGEERLVEVQYHANKRISPRCLQHDIIPKSGISEEIWKKWGDAGNKKARKEIQYEGALVFKEKSN